MNRSRLEELRQSLAQPFAATSASMSLAAAGGPHAGKESSELFLPKIRFEAGAEQVHQYLDEETSNHFKHAQQFKRRKPSKPFEEAFKL